MNDSIFASDVAMNESDNPPPGSLYPAPRAPAALTQRSLRGIVCVLGNRGVKGPWSMPPHLRVMTILGNSEIDLREAQFESDTSVIEIVSIMGNVTITVPPDVVVECNGETFLGSFEIHRKKDVRDVVPPPGAPRVRVVGHSYLGNADVIVRRRVDR